MITRMKFIQILNIDFLRYFNTMKYYFTLWSIKNNVAIRIYMKIQGDQWIKPIFWDCDNFIIKSLPNVMKGTHKNFRKLSWLKIHFLIITRLVYPWWYPYQKNSYQKKLMTKKNSIMDKMSSTMSKYVYWLLVINYNMYIHVRFNIYICVDLFWGVKLTFKFFLFNHVMVKMLRKKWKIIIFLNICTQVI